MNVMEPGEVSCSITELKRVEAELRWKTAFMEAQVNSSPDGMLVVDTEGRKLLQNQRMSQFWKIPAEIASDLDDGKQLQFVLRQVKHPEEFLKKVEYLYAHPQEVSRDENELFDGTVLDRYSSPVLGEDGFYYGRIWTFRDVTELKRTENQTQVYKEQLRALSARIETLREEERTRISREIHDELGQMLTGIKMDLRWMEHRLEEFGDDRRINPILDKLVAATELTDATVKTVQRIASELRPGILDELGLPMALQYEAGRFEERTGVACRLVAPDDTIRLRPEVATAFFRIFQEALTNVNRHAKATAVEAELRVEVDGCRLDIRDDGKGMSGVDLANPHSLGLLGMRERANLLGGVVSFSPRAGGGTVVTVQIPCNPAEPGGA